MQKYRVRAFFITCFVVFESFILLYPAVSASETCYLNTPAGFQDMGGASRIGPYSSRSECEAVNSQSFHGNGSCSCTSTSTGDRQPADNYLRQQRDEAERRYRPTEPERQEVERAEEEARIREEEHQKQFEQNKQKVLEMLKSGTGELGLKGASGGGLKLKGEGSSELTLKEPRFSKGYKGSAPPYLGDLDPKWPIVVEPSKVQGGTPEALHSANRKTHVLLDALEVNPGDWEGSIRYLQNRLADSPNDLAVRDALNLVRGYYQGYLGAKAAADNYYKYGVRKWLEGDFDQAARSFARAYRENPDDKLLFRSFAHTLGLRNNSGKCKVSGGCSFFDIPEKSIFEDIGIASEIRQRMKEARIALSADPENLELRATLNYLEGMAGYNSYLDIALEVKTPPVNGAERRAIEAGLRRLGEKDYVEGWKGIAKALGKNADERMILFAIHYAKGLAASQRGETENVPGSLWDQRTSDVYDEYLEESMTEVLHAAMFPEPDIEKVMNEVLVEMVAGSCNDFQKQIKNTETKNPLFGVLSNKKVKLIKEEWSSFFR